MITKLFPVFAVSNLDAAISYWFDRLGLTLA
jgi:hypothetical protein